MVKPVIERQPNKLILLLDRAVIIRRVERADQVEPVRGIAGYRDQPVRLRAGRLVTANHVKVDLRPCGGKRPQWMSSHPVGPQQTALLAGENHKQDGTLGLDGVSSEGAGQRDHAYGARTVVIGAVPNLRARMRVGRRALRRMRGVSARSHAIVIMM